MKAQRANRKAEFAERRGSDAAREKPNAARGREPRRIYVTKGQERWEKIYVGKRPGVVIKNNMAAAA